MDRLNGARRDRPEQKISVDWHLLETFTKDEEDVIDHVRRIEKNRLVDAFAHEIIFDGYVLIDEFVKKSTEAGLVDEAFDLFQLHGTLIGFRLVEQWIGRFTVGGQTSTNETQVQFAARIDQCHFSEKIIQLAWIESIGG